MRGRICHAALFMPRPVLSALFRPSSNLAAISISPLRLFSSETDREDVESVKARLLVALEHNENKPSAQQVKSVLDELLAVSTSQLTADKAHWLQGQFCMLNTPDFGKGKEQSGVDQRNRPLYSLEALGSGMFQPWSLRCSILKIENHVRPSLSERAGPLSYDVHIHFTAQVKQGGEQTELPGTLSTLATCSLIQDKKASSRDCLEVIFQGGQLSPAQDSDLQLWRETFEHENAPSEGYVGRLLSWLGQKISGVVFSGRMEEDGSLRYHMARNTKFKIEILFLDETLRVTRGQWGNVTIATRTPAVPRDCRS